MTHRSITIFVVCCLTLSVSAPNASAIEREIRPSGDDPSGLLSISPARIELPAKPGVVQLQEVELYNDSDEAIDVSVVTTDYGPSSNPRSVGDRVEDGEFGAGDWIVPEVTQLRMEPFEVVGFHLRIETPADAPIGTNFAGVSIRGGAASGAVGMDDNTGPIVIDGVIQAFLTVPGPVDHDLRITDVDVRDTFVLGSQRFAIWDISFENRGTINEHVSGTVDVRSVFGNSAHRVKIKDLLILRGAKRTTRVIWRDLPFVGSFTPEVRVRGDDAKLQTATGERIFVMPWWLPVSIVLALLLPLVWMWWRRRSEWKQYLDEEDWDDDLLVDTTHYDPS